MDKKFKNQKTLLRAREDMHRKIRIINTFSTPDSGELFNSYLCINKITSSTFEPMIKKENTIEILVSGTVQGVYFRKSAKEAAESLLITGWIKNLDNGSVLIRACGTEDNLKRFIEKCKEGSTWSIVTSVEVQPVYDTKTFKTFEIIKEQPTYKKHGFLSRLAGLQRLF